MRSHERLTDSKPIVDLSKNILRYPSSLMLESSGQEWPPCFEIGFRPCHFGTRWVPSSQSWGARRGNAIVKMA